MSLIQKVARVCHKLVKAGGWKKLLMAHGLNIDRPNVQALQRELEKELKVDRHIDGFEDFAREGVRAIEPGTPARSLFYHALASPGVLNGADGNRLGYFPTLADIEDVENYVFGARPPTVAELLEKVRLGDYGRVPELRLAVVVFAQEYRPASQTCHKIHADMVYSRTGIARVGTAPAMYDAERRGFLAEWDREPFAIRVCPARYAPYLAVRMRGEKAAEKAAYLPLRPQDGKEDFERYFWVPVHKLFAGKECLRGADGGPLELDVDLKAGHVNEKLRRLLLVLRATKNAVSYSDEELVKRPFRFSHGIAELSGDTEVDGTGLLVPVPHDRLVEPALLADGTPRQPAVFLVPADDSGFSSYAPPQPRQKIPKLPKDFKYPLSAPEFVHARTEILPDGSEKDLNGDRSHPDVKKRVSAGGYRAKLYVDYTADGWAGVKVGGLRGGAAVDVTPRPAYSLVTAPDFFPACDQRELTEWMSSTAVPVSVRKNLFETPPETLCDQRLPANLQSFPETFDPDEQTVTAVVGLFGQVTGTRTEAKPGDTLRHSHLPDDAAGVFDPGWDVTYDATPEDFRPHMAAYGLGSPFPEDVKLCAALSAYWPGVTPDTTRTYPRDGSDQTRTVAPLTDDEIGQSGDLPWDGVRGPRLVQVGRQVWADFPSFDHVDYVSNALDRRFSLRLTARVDSDEYQQRVLAMALVYQVLERNPSLGYKWVVLSFRSLFRHRPAELENAQLDAGTVLHGDVYWFELCPREEVVPSPEDFRRRRMLVTCKEHFFVDPLHRRVLRLACGESHWKAEDLSGGSR
jgi:hypothetical protein